MTTPAPVRGGEYAERGDYHRAPDPRWSYYPTYVAKLRMVRAYLRALPPAMRVLDAGCGEGILVEEFSDRLHIEGIDEHYQSVHVRQASVTALPFGAGAFDRCLCLDVLEHLRFDQQESALAELRRVLAPGGELLVTVPNLAHLQSRVHFALRGALIRTAAPAKHPGDRPLREYLALGRRAGFDVEACHGIFPTVPGLTHAIRRYPARLVWLHRLLTLALPVPGWCFLAVIRFRARAD